MLLNGTALDRELRHLRKGPALRHPQVLARLGPQTRLAFGISQSDNAAVVRGKVGNRVRVLLGRHSPDLRTAALAALALDAGSDQRRLVDRQEWLAGRLFCDVRTARRRIDDAIAQLVDAIVEENDRCVRAEAINGGWEVRRFRATLRLDTPGPQLYEQRTVVPTTDSRSSLVCRLSLPRRPGTTEPAVHARAAYGGTIVNGRRVSSSHFEFVLDLPRTVRPGESHDYGIVFSVPTSQQMQSHYVYQPLSICDEFELIVRFDPAAPPRQVWRLTGIPIRVVDDDKPGPDHLCLGDKADVRLRFRELQQGLAYGVKWLPSG